MSNLQARVKKLAITTASLFAGLFLLGGRRASAYSGQGPEVGQVAPDFSLPSQDGTPVQLKEYRGKWVVLYFYPKDNTPGCTIEANSFQRDLPKYADDNSVIIGISVDSSDSHRKFCVKQGLTFSCSPTERQRLPPNMALSRPCWVSPLPPAIRF